MSRDDAVPAADGHARRKDIPVTLGVFLVSAGLFLVLIGVTGRIAVWIIEQLPR